jgi:hypothetical protein
LSKNSVSELCRKLKASAETSGDTGPVNKLRLRILDYFIDRGVADDIFEEVLKARINDPDPTKEESKLICAQILEAWQSSRKE